MGALGIDVVEWLASGAAQKNGISRETATQYKTCVRAVLSAQVDGLDTELRLQDLDAVATTFREANRADGGRSPQTVETYVSAFKAATRAFLRLADADADADSDSDSELLATPVVLRRWEFPLRADLMLQFELPVDLRPEEAERVGAFVLALAIER